MISGIEPSSTKPHSLDTNLSCTSIFTKHTDTTSLVSSRVLCAQSVSRRLLGFFAAFFQIIRNGISSFLCCFFRKRPSTLTIYERNVDLIFRLSTEFAHRRKQLSEPALKKWWFQQFYDLDPKLQKLLLIEDLILRAPDNGDKRKWAEKNFEQHRTLVTQFVVCLNIETVGGKTYRPKLDVPKLLESLHTYIAVEIDRLHKQQN